MNAKNAKNLSFQNKRRILDGLQSLFKRIENAAEDGEYRIERTYLTFSEIYVLQQEGFSVIKEKENDPDEGLNTKYFISWN